MLRGMHSPAWRLYVQYNIFQQCPVQTTFTSILDVTGRASAHRICCSRVLQFYILSCHISPCFQCNSQLASLPFHPSSQDMPHMRQKWKAHNHGIQSDSALPSCEAATVCLTLNDRYQLTLLVMSQHTEVAQFCYIDIQDSSGSNIFLKMRSWQVVLEHRSPPLELHVSQEKKATRVIMAALKISTWCVASWCRHIRHAPNGGLLT